MSCPDGLELMLHRCSPQRAGQREPVLLIHGATFPTALASGYRIAGRSWMEDLASRGLDAWALDFAGFGGSDRFPEMSREPDAGPPALRAEVAAEQIRLAVEAVSSRCGIDRVSLVAHSWGTMPAGVFATRHAERVARLVLFGPVAPRQSPRTPRPRSSRDQPCHHDISLEQQWASFLEGLPEGVPAQIDSEVFAHWGRTYLRTDPGSETRTPPAVRVPFGPIADVLAARRGDFPYELRGILAPSLVVCGEWDAVTSATDLGWFRAGLASAAARRVATLPRGTHRMHLEAGRKALFDEIGDFLTGSRAAETTEGTRSSDSSASLRDREKEGSRR